MIYGELIIGLPGSGKTTYIKHKKDFLSCRNIYTVNLDPGIQEVKVDENKKDREKINDNSDHSEEKENFVYDFDIRKFYNTRDFMKNNEIGPNLAVKKILELFTESYDNFRNIFCNDGCYYLIDTPGQLESIIVLEKLLVRLLKDNVRLVTVFLADINSLTSVESLSYTYFTTLQTMVILNNSQVNVFTKFDFFDSIRLIDKLRNILEINLAIEKFPEFFRVLYNFVERESLLEYQVLEYKDDVVRFLQFFIDQTSGYIDEIEDENDLSHYLKDLKQKDEILDLYEEKEESFLDDDAP